MMNTREDCEIQAWCLVRGGGRSWALAPEAVAEVVAADNLVALPLGWPGLRGLCVYRRELLPILDLDASPCPEPASTAREGREPATVLILRSDQGAWGLRIERGGVTVAEGRFHAEGAPLDAPARGAPVVIGTLQHGETTHLVIDHEATWRNTRGAIENWYRDGRAADLLTAGG